MNQFYFWFFDAGANSIWPWTLPTKLAFGVSSGKADICLATWRQTAGNSSSAVHIYLLTHLLIYLLTCLLTYLITYLHTYLLTYLLTCLVTYLYTYLFTYLLSYLLACLLAYLLTYLLTYLLIYLLTCLLNYLLTCLLTYKLTYLLTYLFTYLLTYSLTPCSKVLLDKLTGSQLVKKFPALHESWRFITTFTTARQLSLSWASSIQSMPPHPSSWRSILILSSHLRLGLFCST